MRRSVLTLCWAAVTVVSGALCQSAVAQKFEVVTGKAFDSAMPKDFYLEGNAIPTEKRNAVLVKTPAGARALFALIDTSGYAASITAKYVGMIITEGDLKVCGHKITVGSYGFGWVLPEPARMRPAGSPFTTRPDAPVADCTSPRQGDLKMPRPLQVVVAPDGAARLYHGRHYISLQ